jgi:hypothetical protein
LNFSLLLPDVPVVPLGGIIEGREKSTNWFSQRLVKIAHWRTLALAIGDIRHRPLKAHHAPSSGRFSSPLGPGASPSDLRLAPQREA